MKKRGINIILYANWIGILNKTNRYNLSNFLYKSTQIDKFHLDFGGFLRISKQKLNSGFARLDEIKIESNKQKQYRIAFFSTSLFNCSKTN